MDLEAITAQLPSDPKVQIINVDIGPWKDGDWISVHEMKEKYSPEDAFLLVSKNIPTIFGPRARIVTYRILNDMAKSTPVDIWYQVYKEKDFGGDSWESFFDDCDCEKCQKKLKKKDREVGFLGNEFKKASIQRFGGPDDLILVTEESGMKLGFSFKNVENLDEKYYFSLFTARQRMSPFVPRCAEPLVVTFV